MANQNAAQDQNQFPALIAHTGTAGTSETVRLVADSAGALSISGASSGTVVEVNTGTIASVGTIPGIGTITNIGTVGTIAGLAMGTYMNISTGSQQTLGTVGSVNGVGGTVKVDLATRIDGTNDSIAITSGTIQSSGTTTGVGTVTNIGTLKGVDSVAELVKGTINSVGTIPGVGTITNIGTIGSIVGMPAATLAMNSGTITTGSLADIAEIHTVGTIGSITNIGVLHNGTVNATLVMDTGTITTGSLANIAYIHSIGTMPAISMGDISGGTIDLITDGTVQVKGGTVTIPELPKGTVTLVTGVGTLGSISNIAVVHNAGTIAGLPDLPGGTVDLVSALAVGTVVGATASAGTPTTNPVLIAGTDGGGAAYAPLVAADGKLTVSADLGDLPGGTVDLVTGLGTLGSISNIAVIHNAGTIAALPTLNLTTGTITTGSLTNLAMIHNGTLAMVKAGTMDVVTSITNVANLAKGTVTVVDSVTNVANLAKGTITIATGVGTLGSISDIAKIHNAGTIAALPTLNLTTGTITTIAAGTQNTLGTVAVVNNIVTGTLASVKINATPAGSTILTTHVLGTGGGTAVGTIVAPAGAGTNLYITGISIVVHSGGSVDCGIANNVAGTTGAGVLARGFFPIGGGIARDFNPAINVGANGTLAYFLITAGTASFNASYWVSP